MNQFWTAGLYLSCCGIILYLIPGGNGYLEKRISADELVKAIPDSHHRVLRSVEGAPCTTTGGQPSIYYGSDGKPLITPSAIAPNILDSCLFNGLPNTRCNALTGKCECDPTVSARLSIIPNAAICLPLAYVNNTNGLCLPSFPDMCSVLVSGSYCASVQTGNTHQLKCQCHSGSGNWPNCPARLGSPCQNSTVCQNQIPNSYCANVTSSGYGTCQCPSAGISITVAVAGANPPITRTYLSTQATIPNLSQSQCVPIFCPYVAPVMNPNTGITTNEFIGIQPCQGETLPVDGATTVPTRPDQVAFTCSNNTLGYQCSCNPGAKGRQHNASVVGRCCNAAHVVCSDYSRCLTVNMLCDGTPDCDDCSDEKYSFCSGTWPTNPACGFPNRSPTSGGSSDSDAAFGKPIQMVSMMSKSDTVDAGVPGRTTAALQDPTFTAFTLPNGKSFQDLTVVTNSESNLSEP